MQLKSVKDIDVKDKRVLVRVDYNVPFDKTGRIQDETRILRSLPTIEYLKKNRAKIILMSHLGRPEGRTVEELRLEPVARRLSSLLGEQVLSLKKIVGNSVAEAIDAMEPGEILMLENLRFDKGEEENDQEFSKKLASLADVYINDAFGVTHREHASTAGVANYLPSAAGLLLTEEIKKLDELFQNPKKPFVAVMGGVKISTKIAVITKLVQKVDFLLLGGALACTILKSIGREIGKSKIEDDMVNRVGELGRKVELPIDYIVAKEADNDAKTRIVKIDEVQSDDIILDIGPETIQRYAKFIKKAETIVWNGPMGMFEVSQFSSGSYAVARAIAGSKADSVAGGGETLEVISKLGLQSKISFISTGGGAMLKYLEGKRLPALEKLIK